MSLYFEIVPRLAVVAFIIFVLGLIYSFIRKKSKKPWVLGIILSFVYIFAVLLFGEMIYNRVHYAQEQIEDTSEDPEGTVRLEPGKYIVGEDDIVQGMYDLSYQSSGSFEVISVVAPLRNIRDYKAFDRFEQSRIYIGNGDGLEIMSGIGILVPAENKEISYESTDIYSGIWIVGETIAPGEYRVSGSDNGGNIFVYKADGRARVNEVLSEDYVVELFEGEVVKILSAMFTLEPTN